MQDRVARIARVERIPASVGSSTVYIAVTDVPRAEPAEAMGSGIGAGAGSDEHAPVGGMRQSLDDAFEAIKAFSDKLTGALTETRATRVVAEFGCEFALEGGGLIAVFGKASASSSLRVTLEWDRTEK